MQEVKGQGIGESFLRTRSPMAEPWARCRYGLAAGSEVRGVGRPPLPRLVRAGQRSRQGLPRCGNVGVIEKERQGILIDSGEGEVLSEAKQGRVKVSIGCSTLITTAINVPEPPG